MLSGLIFFWSGIKKNVFGNRGLPPNQEIYNKKILGIPQKTFVPIVAFLAAPVIAYLLAQYKAIGGGETFLGDKNIVNILFVVIGIAVLVNMAIIITKSKPEERKKLIMAVLITFFMTLFWGFHELSGSIITLFADRNVNLTWLNASQTNALNPVFIIILSIPISLLWAYLSKRNLNPRTPYKFGLGLVLAGASFYVLGLSGASADENGLVPMAYLMVMYFILSIGELFMSPVGLSKITDLSPKRIVAFMMGVWFLSSAFAFQIVGFISKQLSVESTDANVGGMQTLSTYTDGFNLIGLYSLGAGAIVLLFSPLMKKLLGNVH
jgi:POT family proton-dependent oligopeptide transporter